jgi:hypothetical protein
MDEYRFVLSRKPLSEEVCHGTLEHAWIHHDGIASLCVDDGCLAAHCRGSHRNLQG